MLMMNILISVDIQNSLCFFPVSICELTIFNSFNAIVLFFQLTSTSAIAAYINGSTVSVIMLLVGGSMVTEVDNVKVVEGSWCRMNLDLSPDSHQLNGKMTT